MLMLLLGTAVGSYRIYWDWRISVLAQEKQEALIRWREVMAGYPQDKELWADAEAITRSDYFHIRRELENAKRYSLSEWPN